jgi:hypothetical protein
MRSGATSKQLAADTDPVLRRLKGLVRRMAVGATTRIIWRLTGVRLEVGTEQLDAEVFSGLGVYARPTANSKAEAIVVNVGGAQVPVIVATRDAGSLQTMMRALGGKPAAGELIVFAPAGGAVIYCKADGTVEVRTPGGTAARLAKFNPIQQLRNIFSTWVPVPMDGGAALKALLDDWLPEGTDVLKGE